MILKGSYDIIARANVVITNRNYREAFAHTANELHRALSRTRLPKEQLGVATVLLSHLCERDTGRKALFPKEMPERPLEALNMADHYHESVYSWISGAIRVLEAPDMGFERDRVRITHAVARELLEGLPYPLVFAVLLYAVTLVINRVFSNPEHP